MRIATWNVDSIRARMELVEAWIDHVSPDVICLQETKVADRLFPHGPFKERGYEVAAAGEGGQGGVALASRIELANVTIGIPGARAPLNEIRSISADVGPYRLHTLYGPNGRKVGTRSHQIKLAWLQLFTAWVGMDRADEAQPVVVAGDINIAPADDDIWEAQRYRARNLTSPPERAAFDALLNQGLVDIVRAYHGPGPLFSWWNRRGDFYAADRGWRLDHILCDHRTAESVTHVAIDRHERGRAGSSDHAPVIADLGADCAEFDNHLQTGSV